ncbi:acyltransferase [Antricoccus suffuscus]|uniref:acyltransferase n=1 Tax=Antricoccus suffuscus TaxID=1629062 RepID=UPI0023540F04|nr:acyltransferase [Antricoccus suffuscus]
MRESVFLFSLKNLEIGNRVSIHPMCYIDASGGVRIGDDVSVAHGVTIMSTEHQFVDISVPIRDQPIEFVPVVINNDVWIGAGAKILAGVSVGHGSVVAAGAVVTRDVPPLMVVAGVPARVLGARS